MIGNLLLHLPGWTRWDGGTRPAAILLVWGRTPQPPPYFRNIGGGGYRADGAALVFRGHYASRERSEIVFRAQLMARRD